MKKKLLMIVITITIFTIYMVYPIIAIKKQVWDFRHLLADVSLTVRLSGTDYRIDHGKVTQNVSDNLKLKILSLVAFYQWDKEDPLFDSPDFDPDSLARSVVNLQSEQSQLLKVLDTNQELYPVDLLAKITEAAQLNRQFLASPSDKVAGQLISKQLEVARLYADSATNLRSNITPIENKPVSFNVQLSTAVVRDDLQLASDNARSLQSEITKRQICLVNNTGCERPYLEFPKNLDTLDQTYQQPQLLPRDLIFKGIGDGQFPIEGPYRVSTNCFGWGQNFTMPEYFFYVGFPTQGQGYIEPLLATDTFFRKIPADSTVKVEKILFQNGQRYIIQRPNAYICPATAYLNELGEVDSFVKYNQPILNNLKDGGKLLTDAQKAEKDFFNAHFQSYSQLDSLANYYASLYRFLALSSNDSPLKDQLLDRYLDIKDKLAYYGLFLNKDSYILDYYLRVSRIDPASYNLNQFLYPFESDYSLSFFTFSPSVWRLQTAPNFLLRRMVLGAVSLNGGYISYNQAKSDFTLSEINSWFNKADLSLGGSGSR